MNYHDKLLYESKFLRCKRRKITLSENAIELKNVRKKFKVYSDKGTSIKDKLLFWSRNKYHENWVLNDISFNI